MYCDVFSRHIHPRQHCRLEDIGIMTCSQNSSEWSEDIFVLSGTLAIEIAAL